jgi:hypothetical protein
MDDHFWPSVYPGLIVGALIGLSAGTVMATILGAVGGLAGAFLAFYLSGVVGLPAGPLPLVAIIAGSAVGAKALVFVAEWAIPRQSRTG